MSTEFDIVFAGGKFLPTVELLRVSLLEDYLPPSLRILIVESGQHTRDIPSHVQPCRFIEHLAPNSTTLSFNVAKSNPHLNGRAAVVPCGRSVGGGSTVNFKLYMRGAASDYDDWSALGNEGWSFAQLLPLTKKLEAFPHMSDRSTHGFSGPIQISTGGANFGLTKQFLEMCSVYDPTRPRVNDINDFKTANAYSSAYKYIDATGKRSDAASRYLYPHSENSNLKILVGKHVKRVIIENGHAVGIEYMAEGSGMVSAVNASRLVVISAGAFGSPAILERSGIGAHSVLEKYNIRVLVDLPGVGDNYQDHLSNCSPFYASNETDTMDDVWRDPEANTMWLKKWEDNGTGKIADNGIAAMMKVRPTAEQLASAGPALQSRWETFFQHKPDKPLGSIVPFASFIPRPGRAISDRKYFSVSYQILYPESIGSVHITSGEDVNSPPDFDPEFCSKPGDVAELNLLYKMMRELGRRMPTYRGEVAAYHPKFPPGSPAACKEIDDPVPIDAPDIVYSAADDEAIEKFTRDRVSTTWHSLGTCAMKPRNQNGVVDARLNVYGVEGLKVADMSICPTNVGNNTYSTALLIGEKAAAIIAEDLGIALE